MKQRCAALVAVLGRQRCWKTRTLPKKIADSSWLLVITASHSLRCSGMSRLNSILADHSLIAKLRLPISPWLNCKLNRYMRAFQLCQQETYPYIFTAFVCKVKNAPKKTRHLNLCCRRHSILRDTHRRIRNSGWSVADLVGAVPECSLRLFTVKCHTGLPFFLYKSQEAFNNIASFAD